MQDMMIKDLYGQPIVKERQFHILVYGIIFNYLRY